ncbi:PIN domain-containing protein [Streptomyces sp. JNUCC 63]
MADIPVVTGDTNALYRLFTPKDPRHLAHREALARADHLVVSPLVLSELDYLPAARIGAHAAMNALDFIAAPTEARRFTIPDTAPHLRSATAVMRGYADADGGAGGGSGGRDERGPGGRLPDRRPVHHGQPLPHDATTHR